MNRKKFLRSVSFTGLGMAALPTGLLASFSGFDTEEQFPELTKHKIKSIKLGDVNFQWPHLVGKNAKLDVHGQRHR
ncbi:hypothetical protein [Flavihumibacter sp. UBA7668]|uniref:hypothetical protein n=1 Tax=Flavihumibacter sp. UBA7668 TaxID=1946542 RepID=UPI0025BA6EF0|nr:hypothetical protein [Flavihumibacter sp. UBA7668]